MSIRRARTPDCRSVADRVSHVGGSRGHFGDLDAPDRLAASRRPAIDEDAQDRVAGSGGARCEQSCPALSPELLADVLKRRPGRPAWQWQTKPHAHQAILIAQIRDLYLDLPDVMVVRDRVDRRQASLGQVAIPLPYRGVGLIG